MVKLWDRMLLLPTVVRLASRAAKDPNTAWERYWNGIQATGPAGDVLWDSGSAAERDQYRDLVTAHFDPALPVVDVGCGNGTHTRWLAEIFPRVVGIDVSTGAVARAAEEAKDVHNAEFIVLNAADGAAGELLFDRLGPANVFVRGVFHVLKPDQQTALAATIRMVIGTKGRAFIAETNFPGSSLDYLAELGATRGSVPRQLQKALENLPRPGRFGARERQAVFPDADWQLLDDGPLSIEVVPMTSEAVPQRVPGYFALMAGARKDADEAS